MAEPSLQIEWRERLACLARSMDDGTPDLAAIYADLEQLLADMRLTALPVDHELFARVHEQLARCLRQSPDTMPAKALAAGMSHILRPLYDADPHTTDSLEAQEIGQAGIVVARGVAAREQVAHVDIAHQHVASKATTAMAMSWWWERQKRRWWAPLGLLAMGTMALLVM